MTDIGIFNKNFSLATSGLKGYAAAYYNLPEAELVELAVSRKEARLTAHGAVVALTGQHTGRSAKDKFVVRDANTEPHVWWDNNKPMSTGPRLTGCTKISRLTSRARSFTCRIWSAAPTPALR